MLSSVVIGILGGLSAYVLLDLTISGGSFNGLWYTIPMVVLGSIAGVFIASYNA